MWAATSRSTTCRIPAEDNPALGLRGVRVSLWRPDLLRIQLRAILRLGPAANARIMVPMVSSLSELAAVRAAIREICVELGRTEPVAVGVMIETPAAAVTADLICAEADFISIGTNDLAQYALAMDRGNPLLAAQIDGLHPAVLRLIAEAVAGARLHNRPVGVCGGLASDLAAAPILIGLGVTSLSVSPAIVPELKALIRTLSLTGLHRPGAAGAGSDLRCSCSRLGSCPRRPNARASSRSRLMAYAGPRLSLSALQPLGRSLMLPIAVLPVAGLLLRLGQSDMLNIAFMAAAGDAIFSNLGLLFAIGVGVGFARDGNGAAGLAGVVCFLVATNEALRS